MSLQNLPKLTLKDLTSNLHIGVGGVLLTTGVHILWKQWRRWSKERHERTQRPSRLIVITGCDSGLGFSMAYWAATLGYKVIAGCLDLESHGGQILRKEFGMQTAYVVQLDVTNADSIQNLVSETAAFLERNADENLKLWAVIPNAAVACFGEFFWLTLEHQHRMMDVNFWGTVNVAKAFEPMLLAHPCRLIVIASDCSEYPLPALSMYSATKSAVHSWAVALRLEVAKYGVSVVTFQPGSFPTKSNLFLGQKEKYAQMKSKMSEDQKKFYGKYFEELNEYVIGLFDDKPTTSDLLSEKLLYLKFRHVLEGAIRYEPIVAAETLSVKIFHLLSRLPCKYSDPLILAALKYPKWKKETK